MHVLFRRTSAFVSVFALALVLAAAAAAAHSDFTVTPLVSDNGAPGTATDGNLVNAWGLAASSTSPWWVADNGKSVSTLYNGAGVKIPLTVAVSEDPTGVVFNSPGQVDTTAFDVVAGGTPAAFVFDGEGGTITAWNGSQGTTAKLEVDQASVDGAVFKGLAIAQTSAGPRLYATDFHNRRVDVYDGNWQPINRPFQFFDPTIPRNYGPFGIQTIGDRIFVTYAKTQPGSNDEAHGQGLGFVDSFDAATGILDGKVAMHGQLNAPWGLAMAPDGFGDLRGDLLVGNFGDGRIHAYRPILGGLAYVPAGRLDMSPGSPVHIDGLWALEFGNGANAGPKGTLFFTAGPNDENDGLFGTITPN
jgi:uncharacterized protein (TIGR03118 family)